MPRTSVPTYLLGQKAGFYGPAFFVPVFYFGKFFKEQLRDEVGWVVSRIFRKKVCRVWHE